MTVVEGAWAKAAPSGGGNDYYIIHATVDRADSDAVTLEESVDDIVTANAAGKVLIIDGSIVDSDSAVTHRIYCPYYIQAGEEEGIPFFSSKFASPVRKAGLDAVSDEIRIFWDHEEGQDPYVSVEFFTKSYWCVPAYSLAEAGKSLKVDSQGKLVWQS